VTRIPQRELRNDVSAVLRRAERGERLTLTVDGRPVAELGPLPDSRAPASPAALTRILADAPVDATWAEELERTRDEDRADAVDPWQS